MKINTVMKKLDGGTSSTESEITNGEMEFESTETPGSAISEVDSVVNEVAEVAENFIQLVEQVDENTANLGTKLYKHEIEIDDDGTLHYMKFVSTISSQITDMASFITNMKNGLIQVGYARCYFVNDNMYAQGQPIIDILNDSALEIVLTDGAGGTVFTEIRVQADFADTVTPL